MPTDFESWSKSQSIIFISAYNVITWHFGEDSAGNQWVFKSKLFECDELEAHPQSETLDQINIQTVLKSVTKFVNFNMINPKPWVWNTIEEKNLSWSTKVKLIGKRAVQERAAFCFVILWPKGISEQFKFVKRHILLEGINEGMCLSIYNRSGISLTLLFICVVGGRVE